MKTLLKHPTRLLFIALFGSLSILGGALMFQYIGGLSPCKMCIWQRWPHGIGIALLLLALMWHGKARIFAAIAALVSYFIGAGIGIFHSGVEWKFWEGPASCSGKDSSDLSAEELLNSILNAPVVRCDDIVWQFLGLSMAGWNAVLSLGIAATILLAIKAQIQK